MPEIVTFSARLEVGAKLDGDKYVACCPTLDVYSQGETRQAAMASLKEAIDGWFESCIQRGILDQALREVGFVRGKLSELSPPDAKNVVQQTVQPPPAYSTEYLDVTIPAYVAAHNLETSAPC